MKKLLCPCCGQSVELPLSLEVLYFFLLPGNQRLLLDRLTKTPLETVTMPQLIFALYGNRVDGGPVNAKNIVYQTIVEMRKRLKESGWYINNNYTLGYILSPIEQKSKYQ